MSFVVPVGTWKEGCYMKKIIFTIILLLGAYGNVWGLSYTGSISSDNGLYGTASWSEDATLSWVVVYDPDTMWWTYTYTFSVTNKSPSHEILEVSSGDNKFTEDNLIDYSNIVGAEADPVLGVFSTGGSNPGLPGDIYGIKWDSAGNGFIDTWTIVSDRAPMWGDFYAKDGTDGKDAAGNQIWVYAFNTGFGNDTGSPIADGNAYDVTNGWAWVLVPDSEIGIPPQEVVPEPGTLLLMGGGLMGLAFFGRRRFRK
jgi:hypothetical protein